MQQILAHVQQTCILAQILLIIQIQNHSFIYSNHTNADNRYTICLELIKFPHIDV